MEPAYPDGMGNQEFAPGALLGGTYRLVQRLGRGGMGDVHLASHERLPGKLVVKVLSPEVVGDQDALVRFRQEAVVMANVRHPNVVQLVDFNSTPSGLPYLVMEHLPGKDLGDILASHPYLSGPQVSTIVRQVACALDAAHRLGIVHRDLKPENIMVVPCVGQGDLIKVIDFGISKARRFNHVTSASMVMGTPEFMSPEQAQGRHEDVDARSDQFALAVISYLLLTGRTPWGATASVEILHRIVNKEPLPLTGDDSWPSVEAVLFRAMEKSPGDRYPSVLAFWRALDRAMVDDGLFQAPAQQPLVLHGQGASALASAVDGELARSSLEASPPEGQKDQEEEDQGDSPRARALDETSSWSGPRGDTAAGARKVEPWNGSDRLRSLAEGGGEDRHLAVGAPRGDADPADGTPTRPLSREGRGRRHRWHARHVWEAAALVVVLVCGSTVGLLGASTLGRRALTAWHSVGVLGTRAAAQTMGEGERLLSRVGKISGAFKTSRASADSRAPNGSKVRGGYASLGSDH